MARVTTRSVDVHQREGGEVPAAPRALSSRAAAWWAARRLPAGLAAVVLVVDVVLAVRRYQRFTVPSWDLGIFDQALRSMAAGHPPIATIKGVDANLFGDHFHPVLVVLVPLYWIFHSQLVLLVAQAGLIAVSAGIVGGLAVEVCGRRAGVALGLAYGFSWGLQADVVAQFHEVDFALPLVAGSLVALVRGRWRACLLWALPLVLVKEDLGLTVAAIGVVLALRRRDRQGAVAGAALAAWGVGWSLFAVEVVLPAVNRDGSWTYGSQVDWSVLADPAGLQQALTTPHEKLTTLAYLAAVTGFLALRSPIALVAVPTLSWRYLADVPAYWGRDWHYSAILMPILFVALLDAVQVLRTRPHRLDPAFLRAYAGAVVPVCATVAVVLSVQGLAVKDLVDPQFWRGQPRDASTRAVLALVPPGTSVESDAGLITYLVPEHQVYWMGRRGNPAPDYLLVDAVKGGWSPAPDDVVGYAQGLHPGHVYETVFSQDDYTLVRRRS